MLELEPRQLEAIASLYRVAGAVLGSMDVDWSVNVQPSAFGEEISLRVAWGRQGERRMGRLTITDAMLRNEGDGLERFVIGHVREMAEAIRGA